MKEIVSRLTEKRQVELAKSILEGAEYKVVKEAYEDGGDVNSTTIRDHINDMCEELNKYNGLIFGQIQERTAGEYFEPEIRRIDHFEVTPRGCSVYLGFWSEYDHTYNYHYVPLSKLTLYISSKATISKEKFLSMLEEHYKQRYAEHIDPEEYTDSAIDYFRSKHPSETKYVEEGMALYTSAFDEE